MLTEAGGTDSVVQQNFPYTNLVTAYHYRKVKTLGYKPADHPQKNNAC